MGKFAAIYPILMRLSTEGAVTTEPITTEEIAASAESIED
jgi:hypothetical protein